MNVDVWADVCSAKRQRVLHRRCPAERSEELFGLFPVRNSLYPSHCLGVVLSCSHWLIWISGSWEFVLTPEGWGNGPFITLMEEYWLWCRSTIPVCNSNGLPEKSQMKRHQGISRRRETPLPPLLAPCYLCGKVCVSALFVHDCVRIEK